MNNLIAVTLIALTIPFTTCNIPNIPDINIPTNPTNPPTNTVPTDPTPPTAPDLVFPVEIGNWGGRPSCALDSKNQLHIVVDGSMSPKMLICDIIGNKLTTTVLDGNTWNPLTKQIFNPSQVIFEDGTQLISGWWFAALVEAGCTPLVLYRSNVHTAPTAWKSLVVRPSTFPWEVTKLCPLGKDKAVDFGLVNAYYELSMVNGTLTLGTHSTYGSGNAGGGEKEARMILPDGTKHVANSGSSKTTGGWYRNSKSCNSAARWAAYTAYPKMGNDDIGHCAVAGDLKDSRIGYMCASWDKGLVFNVWDGSKMLYPIDNLPVIDAGGWSGLYKYPLSMASNPKGGADIVWCNGNGLFLGTITTNGLVSANKIASGTIGTLCIGSDGVKHVVYNSAGKIMYKQIKE